MPVTIDLNASQIRIPVTTGPIVASAFVKAAAYSDDLGVEQAGLGDPVFGVALEAGATDDVIVVDRGFPFLAPVLAAEALATDDIVMSDADGYAMLYDDDPDHAVVGKIVVGGGIGASVSTDSTAVGSTSVGGGRQLGYAAAFQATNTLTDVVAGNYLALSTHSNALQGPVGLWAIDTGDTGTHLLFPATGIYAFAVETYGTNFDQPVGVLVDGHHPGGGATVAELELTPTADTSPTQSGGGYVVVEDLIEGYLHLRATWVNAEPTTFDSGTVLLRVWRVGGLA